MEEIFLKIALAESDGAFESVLGKYLPQVIESLETNQQKALEIITHVKKRVTSRPEWDKIMTSSVPSVSRQLAFASIFQLFR